MLVPKQTFLFFFCNYKGQCYFLDSQGQVQTGNLSSGNDYSLPDSPAGWLDQELSWSRNQKYHGFIRSYGPDLKFVKKSANIIRKLYYIGITNQSGKGIETQIYFVATKWNPTSGIYELYYKAELDFTQYEDNPVEGVTVKTMEGGILKIFKTYENTIFELPIDGSIPQNIAVKINGLMLKAIFNYEVTPFSINSRDTVIPIIFTTKQGNDIGIASGDQTKTNFDETNTGQVTNIINSGNYCFNSVRPVPAGAVISGSISITGSMTTGRLYIMYSDATTDTELIPAQEMNGNTYPFSYTFTSSVPASAQMFLCFQCIGNSGAGLSAGAMQINFESQFEDTSCYVMKPGDVLQLLMSKILQQASELAGHPIQYTTKSSVFDDIANKTLTSGSMLRNNPGAVLKISLANLFEIYNPVECLVLGTQLTINGEILFIERRGTVYNSDGLRVYTPRFHIVNNDVQLGEVAHLKITPATDLMPDIIKFGYPEQKYDNKQGNDEWNTTAIYKTPYKRRSNELNLVCKARADAFGIEYARFLTGTTNTSNNKSDNDIFLLNVDFSKHSDTSAEIYGNLTTAKTILTAFGVKPLLNDPITFNNIIGPLGSSFQIIDRTYGSTIYPGGLIKWNNISNVLVQGTILLEGSTSTVSYNANSGTFEGIYYLRKNNGVEVASAQVSFVIGASFQCLFNFSDTLQFGDTLYLDLYLLPIVDPDGGIGAVFFPNNLTGKYTTIDISMSDSNAQPIYLLNRAIYDSSDAGSINIDYAYNIEGLTPSRMLSKHGAWIRSLFYNMPDKKLYFQSADKNHHLITVSGDQTFSEGTDKYISDLSQNILFLPFYIEFDTQIPQTFTEIMNMARNAHIHNTFYGVDFYGFPHEVKVKPGLNESQHWKLLASPKNLVNGVLSNFADFDVSGLNLLNLQKMSTFISHLNPLKFVPLNFTKDQKYNFLHMDEDWFINQVQFWIQSRNYFQKWQKNDTISLQLITNSIAPAIITVYSSKKQAVTSTGPVAIFDFDFSNLTGLTIDSNGSNNTNQAVSGGWSFTMNPPANNSQSTNQYVLSPTANSGAIPAGAYTININLLTKSSNGTAFFQTLGPTQNGDHSLNVGLNTFQLTFIEDTYLSIEFDCPTADTATNIIAEWKVETEETITTYTNIVETISMGEVSDQAVQNPLRLFQTNISLSAFNEGVYYFVINVGVGSTMDSFISEGVHIKTFWPVTGLFEYKNSFNRLSTIFSSGFTPSFRVESWLDEYMAKSHIAAFEDQPGDMKILNSIPFGNHRLNIGKDYGVPPWVLRLCNMIMGLDDVKYEGLGITRAEQDTEWETSRPDKWPLAYHTLEIREAQNEYGVTVTTEGSIEDEIFVTYQVNQKGFAEFSEGDNILPIRKIE
jgi:hypothetical protein